MNGISSSFCYWCGFSDRNKGICNICYPRDHPRFSSQKLFLAHVLFVRNKTCQVDLNHIAEGIIPHDIRPDIEAIRRYNDFASNCSINSSKHDTTGDELAVISDRGSNGTLRDSNILSSARISKLAERLSKITKDKV